MSSKLELFSEKKNSRIRQPGLEPGALAWEARILPLNH